MTLDVMMKKLQSLKDRFEHLERDVRALKDLLNVHDNWNAMIRKLIGEQVTIRTRSGNQMRGVLKWSDRYNLCIEYPLDSPTQMIVTRVYTKGGIDWIEPYHN